jgi:hypothetical protein
MIERRIVIGLITSTDYLHTIRPLWSDRYLVSNVASRLASWCIEYYDKYQKAPNKDIEGIYFAKLKGHPPIPQDVAEEIEEDILPGLSDQYEREKFNVTYLLDQTRDYFKERSLTLFSEDIQGLVDQSKLTEAELLASKFTATADELGRSLNLGSETTAERLEQAFTHAFEPLIVYPRALGEFWNVQLRRGGFVGFMGSEKRGKTYRLLDVSMMGVSQGSNVAFFQAGDMTEEEQLIRIGEYLTGKNHLKEYSGKMYEPVRDCIYNQMNTCDRDERVCDFGVFSDMTADDICYTVSKDDLVERYKDNRNYMPCTNCKKDKKKERYVYKGAVWVNEVNTGSPLTLKEAQKAYDTFFAKTGRQFQLATYNNGTLTIKEIKAHLDILERQQGFVADIITIDYADILAPEIRSDFRHQQNEIWKGMRNISQERHALVVTGTQADAASYEKGRLRMKNFSEDKRKYGHVTVMYGLNQDPQDRERDIGIMRINELTKRTGASSNLREVTVLQNLSRGRPFLTSYW